MKSFLVICLVLTLASACHKPEPEPPRESHHYDVHLVITGTDYPVEVTATIGATTWADTIYQKLDTTIYLVPGKTKVSLQGNAYADHDIRLRVSIGWDYYHGVQVVYPFGRPLVKIETILPE